LLYLIERTQKWLPFNPQKFGSVEPGLAFDTAASFTTNTNWQAYSGESTMSYLTQMAGLAYHNFVSAAVGIVLAIVVIRGIARKETDKLGNFWVDATRCLLWVLLPICLVGSLALVSQGVIQNLKPYTTVELVEPQTVQVTGADGKTTTQDSDTASDCTRAGSVAGSNQGIRHQRRRILRREQRASIREPHATCQFL
jgi:K+-transporting ATPase ATPase A chain